LETCVSFCIMINLCSFCIFKHVFLFAFLIMCFFLHYDSHFLSHADIQIYVSYN
jgi:hypothetical protein